MDEKTAFALFGVLLVIVAGGFFRQHLRAKKRRATLHRDSNGNWVWVDFDGSERRDVIHPDRPGGAWFQEAGDGGFEVGGGDGGD